MTKGIVLYDSMAVRGGAEKLTLALIEHFPGTDLCVGYINRNAFRSFGSQCGQVFDLRANAPVPLWRILRMIWAFEHRGPMLNQYDWVLFSGIYAPFAVRRRRRGRNLLYCHTIPRFCFDLREHYLAKLSWLFRPILLLLITVVTRKYARALARMEVVIANSENVRQRLLSHFGRDARVIHPPVDTKRFRWLGEGTYYISLARLEDFKRVDQVVRAFLRMPEHELVVASGGSELNRLKALAAEAPNISFTGWLAEEELCELVGHARAAIYVPMDEDFGMSPVEAMAAGKPVIGVAEGGMLETVLHGETGFLIEDLLTPEKICNAVKNLEQRNPATMREACVRRAAMFTEEIFINKMNMLLFPDGLNL